MSSLTEATAVSWAEVMRAAPELAAQVRTCFEVRKHATIATLRRDGAPRISGTEVEFDDDGNLYLGMMPGSRKALDLRRDPRLALHSPTVEPPPDDPARWQGEAKIAGRAVEVLDPARTDLPHRFRIEIGEIVHTGIAATGDRLVIESWHPGRGVERFERT